MAGIFKAYDVRGIYPFELDEEIAYKIGRAIVQYFSIKKVVIGHDHRISSPSLHQAVIKGLIDQGANVIDIGLCSSPELYHYNVTKSLFGVMITASHNPKEYNGIKINSPEGKMINYSAGLNEIEKLVKEIKFPKAKDKGSIVKENYNDSYVGYLRDFIPPIKRRLKIVIDTGNGISGPTLKKLFSEIENIEIVPLFFNPDGTYPNHEANPSKKENLAELSKKIKEVQANLGAAFDGDADRCVFLDEKGNPIRPDIFFCIIADNENAKEQRGRYYFDLWFSKAVKDHLEELGCTYKVLPQGVANYREKLIAEGGIAASEISAHVFFKENLCQDDGFFTLIKAITYINNSEKTLSAMTRPYLIYSSANENLHVQDPDAVLQEVKEKFSEAKQEELDGITISYPEYWFNVRKSNTEPLIRIHIEADSEELLKDKKQRLIDFIRTKK